VFDSILKFDEDIGLHVKINKAYQMLGVIKRNFIYLTLQTVLWCCIKL